MACSADALVGAAWSPPPAGRQVPLPSIAAPIKVSGVAHTQHRPSCFGPPTGAPCHTLIETRQWFIALVVTMVHDCGTTLKKAASPTLSCLIVALPSDASTTMPPRESDADAHARYETQGGGDGEGGGGKE